MLHLPGIRLIGGANSALVFAPVPLANTCVLRLRREKVLLGFVCVLVHPVTPRPSPHVYIIESI